ncbi:Cysteine proteinase inhibitor [Melia azedarach]|uniref:Cysteine proteinase inhibitor n=1 Tax=Melia azedarach TaxID=155640 RepID=A0ACC1X0D3_MELAZ|nr:Cysteine proteinase inhibitor [Melia azedarach]
MKKKSALFILSVLLVAAAARTGALLGGWTPIKDLNDPHVKEIGQFAVAEYNKQSKADLKFQSVVKGESQVVAGINYRLILTAIDGTATNKYEAVVWEKSWEHFRNLTSFKPVK